MKTIYYVIYLSSLVLVVIANSLIVRVMWILGARSNSPMNQFVIAIAFSEILFAVFFVAATVASSIDNEIQGHTIAAAITFGCVVIPYFQLFCVCFNVFCMLAIAIDVYWAVFSNKIQPIIYGVSDAASSVQKSSSWRNKRKRRAAFSLAVVCVASAIYSSRTFQHNLTATEAGDAAISPSSSVLMDGSSDFWNVTRMQTVGVDGKNFLVASFSETTTSATVTGTASLREINCAKNFASKNLSSEFGDSTNDGKRLVNESGENVDHSTRSCNLFVESNTSDMVPRLTDLCFLFIVPIIIQLLIYAKVARKLWSSQIALRGNATSTRHHRQVIKMFLVVLGSFVAFRGPWHLFDLIIDAALTDDDQRNNVDALEAVRQLATILVFINSWTTPIVFALFNIRIRNLLVDVLRCRSMSEHTTSSPRIDATGLVAVTERCVACCLVMSSTSLQQPAVESPIAVIELRQCA